MKKSPERSQSYPSLKEQYCSRESFEKCQSLKHLSTISYKNGSFEQIFERFNGTFETKSSKDLKNAAYECSENGKGKKSSSTSFCQPSVSSFHGFTEKVKCYRVRRTKSAFFDLVRLEEQICAIFEAHKNYSMTSLRTNEILDDRTIVHSEAFFHVGDMRTHDFMHKRSYPVTEKAVRKRSVGTVQKFVSSTVSFNEEISEEILKSEKLEALLKSDEMLSHSSSARYGIIQFH